MADSVLVAFNKAVEASNSARDELAIVRSVSERADRIDLELLLRILIRTATDQHNAMASLLTALKPIVDKHNKEEASNG